MQRFLFRMGPVDVGSNNMIANGRRKGEGMKRILIVLLILLSASFAYAKPGGGKPDGGKPPKALDIDAACLGDSLTVEDVESQPAYHGYPYYLRPMLYRKATLTSHAEWGASLLLMDTLSQEIDPAMDVVVLYGGINDCAWHEFDNLADPSDVKERYTALLDELINVQGHDVAIVKHHPYAGFTNSGNPDPTPAMGWPCSEAFNAWADTLLPGGANEMPGVLAAVDTYSLGDESGYLYSEYEYWAEEGLHLNADGASLLAQLVYDALNALSW